MLLIYGGIVAFLSPVLLNKGVNREGRRRFQSSQSVFCYARFTLTDGGLGDDIPGDGRITDQGGPGIGQGPPEPIPTLNEWGMMLLILLLAGVGVRRAMKQTR